MLAADWTNLGYAGAFVVGAILGTAATIRLAKVLADFLRTERDKSPRNPGE